MSGRPEKNRQQTTHTKAEGCASHTNPSYKFPLSAMQGMLRFDNERFPIEPDGRLNQT